jgi:hypothetical protein
MTQKIIYVKSYHDNHKAWEAIIKGFAKVDFIAYLNSWKTIEAMKHDETLILMFSTKKIKEVFCDELQTVDMEWLNKSKQMIVPAK